MGLGDIDSLETLDRSPDSECQRSRTSSADPDETMASSPQPNDPVEDTPSRILHTESDDIYRLTSADSLAAARWESINAVDLASVLDSFSRDNDTSTPSEGVTYDLCSDGINLREDSPFSGEVDAFMSGSNSELADTKSTVLYSDDDLSKSFVCEDANVISSDYISPSGAQVVVKCESSVVDDESLGSINVSASLCSQPWQGGMKNAAPCDVDRKGPNVNHIPDGRGGLWVDSFQSSQCFVPETVNLRGCLNTTISTDGALDLKESISSQQQGYAQPGMMIHWSKPASTAVTTQFYTREQAASLYIGEQVGQQSPVCIGDNYPVILDQQVRMADAARVTSELKRTRAQASRARRRAASQRRAKKYPLQKLIRMSSSSPSIREKLELGTAPVTPGPQQFVSQNLVRSMDPKAHLPSILPLPLQQTAAYLSSSHDLISHANALQGTLKYQNHHPVTALQEDVSVSPSGSTSLQTQHNGWNAHSLNSLPTYSAANIPDPTHCLDAVLLTQLQNVTKKMNVDTRLCIRDALYRLATSASRRQSRTDDVSGMDENERQLQAIETNTNSIDRWIANMLFCKQHIVAEDSSQPNFAQASNQSMDSTDISSKWHWSSCGSSLSLQEQAHHVLTG